MKYRIVTLVATATIAAAAVAQTALYPKHFALSEVTLLDGPMKQAMDTNIETLLRYDVDRLLTPYVRQSGLAATTDTESRYYQWERLHPSFSNWGDASFNLDGHVGGHYLSALSLACAATKDADAKTRLRQRLDYMLDVMDDCQRQYDASTDGMYGFIGGQPINADWRTLYKGDISAIRRHGGWVPLYCQHKILAGLRDAYLYAGVEKARTLFLKLADWSVAVVDKVSTADMNTLLDIEHGGMNESMADAYQLTGDSKYLDAAKKYTHKTMLNGMLTLSTTFLDGKHANTQVPKYIGMERVYELDATADNYRKAAENFWTDVATNRTVCIGGNSVSEHFLAKESANRYIDVLDGPESCNTNNMLKLSEMMHDRTADARYADFYEQAMWNHILSTQDPQTGGYVYFTTLRPQGYRIYSQVDQAMWCCVGTGMENHSKYGHFIYTHDGDKTLYVNLFTPSVLSDENFGIRQETDFPDIDAEASLSAGTDVAVTRLAITKGGHYTLALRHPAWAGEGFRVMVNGTAVEHSAAPGVASYVAVERDWQEGDVVALWLPMRLAVDPCPGYTDYVAFKYGPILLAAPTTAATQEAATDTGLEYEKLQNEYAGAGRMDHAPGSMASAKSLMDSPLLIGPRDEVLHRIQRVGDHPLRFAIDASREGVDGYTWGQLTLVPFHKIQHARYMCYWYQQTQENFDKSDMAQTEAQNQALNDRTLDFVVPGEQQSEAGHEYDYSSSSTTGTYNTEHYRDAQANGHIQYTLYNPQRLTERLSIMMRFNLADRGRKATLTVDGTKLADITIPASAKGSDANGFYNVEYALPQDLAVDAQGQAKDRFVVRLTASATTLCPGLYYLRLLRDYDDHAYRFVATDWTTGDPWRVAASNITYDVTANRIHVKASGANNVALTLKHNECDYTIDRSQEYLVVRGTNLSLGTGASYLWWLNGSNHGTQVPPTQTAAVTVDGQQQQVVAWKMTASGLYENFSDYRPSVCVGQTIFGLTSLTGESDIVDISFVSDVDAYVDQTVGIRQTVQAQGSDRQTLYQVDGKPASSSRGIVVGKGRKYVDKH